MEIVKTNNMKRGAVLLIAGMGLLLLVGTFLKMTRLTTNPRSRVITVERLVDAGTWAHIAPGDTTPFEPSIDAVRVGDRTYSSKPPLYPLVMAGESIAVKTVTGWGFYDHRVDFLRILVLLNQVLPYLLMLWVAFNWMQDWTQDRWTLYFMLGALGIGLLPFGYAVTINNHTPSAYLFFFAFYLLYRILVRKEEEVWLYGTVGLLVGIGTAIELPAGLFAAWFVGLLVLNNWKKSAWAILGAILPFVPTFWIYHHLSGSWSPFYLQSELYHYEGSYWDSPEGLDLVAPSKGSYIFNMLLGFRGLFSMTPLLLLGLWALVRNQWKDREVLSKIWWGVLAGMVGIGIFVVLRTHNYGGDSIGMRWFIVFMPMLMMAGLPVVKQLRKLVWGRVLLLLLLAWSIPWNLEAIFEEAFVRGMFERYWMAIF